MIERPVQISRLEPNKARAGQDLNMAVGRPCDRPRAAQPWMPSHFQALYAVAADPRQRGTAGDEQAGWAVLDSVQDRAHAKPLVGPHVGLESPHTRNGAIFQKEYRATVDVAEGFPGLIATARKKRIKFSGPSALVEMDGARVIDPPETAFRILGAVSNSRCRGLYRLDHLAIDDPTEEALFPDPDRALLARADGAEIRFQDRL
ncbi:MAG: hypothetical protein ACOVMT_08150, partial [Caulobacter sp.]